MDIRERQAHLKHKFRFLSPGWRPKHILPHTKKSLNSKVAMTRWPSASEEFRHNPMDGSFARKNSKLQISGKNRVKRRRWNTRRMRSEPPCPECGVWPGVMISQKIWKMVRNQSEEIYLYPR